MNILESYESLVQKFGKTSFQISAMQTAINERGGHCKECTKCAQLTVGLPLRLSGQSAHQATYSVRVECTIDPGRIYPHRAEHSHLEDCPSLKRHANLQARQVKQPQAA